MTHRTVFGTLLLLSILLAPSADSQDAVVSQDRDRSIPVRPATEVGTLERLTVAVTRALTPGSKVIAPLYAYSNDLACNPSDDDQSVGRHDGSAAIVVDDGGESGANAYYYSTVNEAIAEASRTGWCDDNRHDTWYLATTNPLETNIPVQKRYLSRDVKLIEAQLQQQQN